MRLLPKKLNSAGVAHHFLIAVLVVVAFASFGAYRVFYSKAATAPAASQYIAKVATENGCELTGRIWKDNDCLGSAALIGKSDPCRNKDATYKTKQGSDGTTRGYCTTALAVTMSENDCVNSYHRMYVKELGCARRAGQDNTNDARQCIGNAKNAVADTDPYKKYVNYVAESNIDKCIAVTIATPPPTGGSGGSTTTAATLGDGDQRLCGNLGRTYDATAKKCKTVCKADAGTLVVAASSTQHYYCTNAVAPDITQARCAELHREWVTVGCARRPDQKDTNAAPQCITGFPYYNANFTTKLNGTRTDVCEVDKATATANEASGTLAGVVITPDTPPITPTDPVDVTPGKFKITVYPDINFKGVPKVITVEKANLTADGWNDKISSYKIQGGRWQICEDADFKTNCTKQWASDPDLTKGGKTSKNDKISSLRPVTTTTFLDAPDDVLATCQDADGIVVTPTENTCPDGSTLKCPEGFTIKGSDCKEAVVKPDVFVPVDDTFKGKDGQKNCELLGREWIGKPKGNKVINGGSYGCSTKTCNLEKDGAPRQNDGNPVCVSYKFDAPYAIKLDEKACKDLHRVWVDQVGLCAQAPNRKDKDQTINSAKQCAGDYKVYYIFKARDKQDECFKQDFFKKVSGVVKSTGGVLSAGLQQGPRAYCSTVKSGNYHWTGKKCVIDRKKCWNGQSIAVTSKCPAQPLPGGGGGDGGDGGQGGNTPVTTVPDSSGNCREGFIKNSAGQCYDRSTLSQPPRNCAAITDRPECQGAAEAAETAAAELAKKKKDCEAQGSGWYWNGTACRFNGGLQP